MDKTEEKKEKTKDVEEKTAPAGEGPGGAGEVAYPPIDFSAFILSLCSAVLMNLGVIKNPVTGKVEKNVAMAKHSIDLLDMLKEKTKGNLTDDEAKLLDDMLADIKMKYVEAAT